jgi:hypothetical protein
MHGPAFLIMSCMFIEALTSVLPVLRRKGKACPKSAIVFHCPYLPTSNRVIKHQALPELSRVQESCSRVHVVIVRTYDNCYKFCPYDVRYKREGMSVQPSSCEYHLWNYETGSSLHFSNNVFLFH